MHSQFFSSSIPVFSLFFNNIFSLGPTVLAGLEQSSIHTCRIPSDKVTPDATIKSSYFIFHFSTLETQLSHLATVYIPYSTVIIR